MYIFRKIILPLIIPDILAGWAMTFTISIRELVASLLVLPPSVETSATFIFAQFEQGEVSIEWRWLSFQLDLQHYVYYFCNIWSKTKRGSMMRIEVWGGAGEYGRSCYFVKIKRRKYYLIVVLIDHMRTVIQK